MATKIETYVDTSALIAFADRSDSYHPLFRRLFSDPPALITSMLVIVEGHGWFLRRFDAGRALQFLALVEAMTPLTVCSFGTQEIVSATLVLRRFADQALTLADATGLQMMDEHRINSCWSTDFHLGLTGVPLVIHQH
ncbi:MAG: PIN domain-containing protein [Gammaproteobacteria bacterium]|nr:PIN domain-containing protein [Gammaproteobacteria bacterium]